MFFTLFSTPSNLNSVGKWSSNVLKHLFLLNNKEQFRCHSLRAWVYNPSTWQVRHVDQEFEVSLSYTVKLCADKQGLYRTDRALASHV